MHRKTLAVHGVKQFGFIKIRISNEFKCSGVKIVNSLDFLFVYSFYILQTNKLSEENWIGFRLTFPHLLFLLNNQPFGVSFSVEKVNLNI